MRISKGSPLVFWPSSICETFPENPSNLLLSGEKEFSFSVEFTIQEEVIDHATVFTLLPRYCGLDVYNNKSIITITYEEEAKYYDIGNIIQPFKRTLVTFQNLPKDKFVVFINREAVLEENLSEKTLGISNAPHIIFGAGNFPKNDFNLNYVNMDLHSFKINHQGSEVTNHLFEEKIFDKFVDTTGNLNFIHKI